MTNLLLASKTRAPRWAAVFLIACALPAGAQPDGYTTSGFKITYGVKNAGHGGSWNGAATPAARVRRVMGWHLHDDDRLREPNLWDVTLQSVGGHVASPGIVLDLVGPETQAVTIQTRRGDFDIVPAEMPYGHIIYPENFGDQVAVERVALPYTVTSQEYQDDSPSLLRTKSGNYWLAWVAYKTRRRDGDYLYGADEVMVAHSGDGRNWSAPRSISPPGDHFRTALGEDAAGRVWCVYGRQEAMGSGNFDLYARRLEGSSWSDAQRLTDDPRPDFFHRLATAPDGTLYLTWQGFRDNPSGGAAQSDILLKRLRQGSWGPEVNLTSSPQDDWEPAITVDKDNRAWVAWDAYRADGFDVLLRSATADGLGETREIAATPNAEMRADVAADGQGRVWIMWEESGVNWGKDTGYENPNHRINLKKGGSRLYESVGRGTVRRPKTAILENGSLKQPSRALDESYPEFLRGELFQSPQLFVDSQGRVWIFLRHQWNAAGRWAGHLFDWYATTWADGKWLTPVWLGGSTGRQDTVVAAAPDGNKGLIAAVVGDGRRLPVGLPKHSDISIVTLDGTLVPGSRDGMTTVPFQPAAASAYQPTHPNEAADLERIRGHRLDVGGDRWKIVRGDLHRHTETSMDGATDGTLYDAYRYALNAAQLDFLGVSDHNYGQWLDTDEPEDAQSDSEFQFWRAQKLTDLFYVPGRFTPLYGYERTTNFPLGHRNIFHATRGVFSLKVPKLNIRERPDLLDIDPPNLWAYLRRTGGIGIPHTSGTTMGTNWQRRDDEVIPVTEIYQGDRNSYETQGGPRAALPDDPGLGSAGMPPHQDGLVQNALGVGYRMGFIASSDHYSTHISYANLIVPDHSTTREDLLDAFRARRSYASTDNIVVDFHTAAEQQGQELTAAESPEFQVRVLGTAPILKIEIVKNNRVVFTREGEGQSNVSFTYRDLAGFGDTSVGPTVTVTDWARPETGIRGRANEKEAYYYLRVIQSYSSAEPAKEGEVAWSSPIFVVHAK